MTDLELYYQPTCPYCLKVLRFLKTNDIEIELKNTMMPENRSKLVEVGGMGQVPCLFIGGKPMYESEDIIAYLRKRLLS